MSTKFHAAAAVAAAALLAAGCGGGGIGGTGQQSGTMRASITDAPSCYEAVNVTVQKVRVHQSAGAAEGDAGWSEIVLSPAKRIDLVPLTNGVLEALGQTTLPAGKYTQLRLVLAESDNANPLANSVVPIGGTETPLATPSAAQSGLKINVDIDVEPDKVVDVVLDFDACKSVVPRGNSGQYNLKPVISATTVVSDAGMRVIGYVHPSIALSSTQVSVQANGVPIKATVPNLTTGQFVLYPVPAGNYDLVVTSDAHVTAVMSGVPVVTTAPTTVNSAAVPIAPASAAMRTVTGTVTPATATVRALQTVAGTPVEAAWGTVDATSGAFSVALPIEAPVKTAYVVNPVTLSFAADPAAAGKYTLQAGFNGATKTQAVDAAAAVPPVAFTFP
jgi:hypothetical protein